MEEEEILEKIADAQDYLREAQRDIKCIIMNKHYLLIMKKRKQIYDKKD